MATSLREYLDQLASPSVQTDKVGNFTRQTLRENIAKLTIDQLAHEREKCEVSLTSLKKGFSEDELAGHSEKYARLATTHKDIFSGQSGKLIELRELNSETHRAMEDLQATLNGKNIDLA